MRVTYEVHPKEQRYFVLKIFFAAVFYLLIVSGLVITFTLPEGGTYLTFVGVFVALQALFIIFNLGFLIGYLRGNAVKITPEQFPDIYDILHKQSYALGLPAVPDAYILEYGGFLNAFATKFMGRNYIVLFSDILEEAYENNKETVEFIIGHELGHIAQNHITKNLVLFPANFVPFLGAAYSRGCEYTCDRVGAALSPKGVIPGLTILASGKKLYKKVNVKVFADQAKTEGGFWAWIVEKFSSHPKLAKRVGEFVDLPQKQQVFTKVEPKQESKEHVTDDHSKYMPGM